VEANSDLGSPHLGKRCDQRNVADDNERCARDIRAVLAPMAETIAGIVEEYRRYLAGKPVDSIPYLPRMCAEWETVVALVQTQAGFPAAFELGRRIETCCENDAADEASIQKALADCLELSDYIAELTE